MKKWYAIYSNILHLPFSEGFYDLPESAKAAISPTSPVKRLLKIAGYTVVRLIGNLFKKVEQPEQLRGKVWLYVVSQNNYDSLQFLQAGLPNVVFVAGQSKEIGRYNHAVARISLRRKFLYYYKFLPLYFTFLKYKKNSTQRFVDVLYDAVGFYEVYLTKLQKYKPTAIVFANDHNADARAMLLAAKAAGIRTAYIQHASVSPIFPPLEYDLNLLEGQDALDKYKLCGPVTGRVELVGMPKADAFAQFRNQNKSINRIGIGCNLMDATEEITALASQLAKDFPEADIILRPHPRDNRDFENVLSSYPNIKFSNSRLVPTFEYLKEIDILLSGNSGIHLEAVLLNVWAIYYNMNQSERLYDYYGFIQKGLVDEAGSYTALHEMLQQHIQNKPEVYQRAKYFNATVGSPYDGKSSELALQLVRTFIAANL
ncbi:hypothetical protein ABID22_002279 [Pontibacter aydingkolensis]|uniref:CDP-Glycerol:Poly(Glycerophosphate) glycerophosphotransferase n=1 Tax=Pontibacter aydingkolensis TaxID=1911536 RepID=A0ABS7CVL1_9BACT|nr:hypothetical protein [Pontibacter aydingkolensis]MBW7467884.1 hypothetical protein [Pontibacter aydingkolensis]